MTSEEQEIIVGEIEREIERLHALYNQYFMGIEKLEPTIPRKEVERKIQTLRREKLANTAIRFRFQTQVQKYTTELSYWRKICRQIEEGTYQPHIQMAKRRFETRQRRTNESPEKVAAAPLAFREVDPSLVPEVPVPTDDIDEPFDQIPRALPETPPPISELDDPFGDAIDAAFSAIASPRGSAQAKQPSGPPTRPGQVAASVPGRTPPPVAAAAPRQAPATGRAAPAPRTAPTTAESHEEQLQRVYRTYLAARKKCSEPTDNLPFEKVAGVLRKQLEKHANIEFKIVIRDGKAVIKTVQKGEG